MFFCLLRKSDTRSSHPEQPLDGFAQFLPRGDEAAVFGEELALDLEAVEGREVEGQDGGVGDGQEAREFGGDGLLFRAGREEDVRRCPAAPESACRQSRTFCRASSGARFMAARSNAEAASFA